jgi:outer membrane protein OmpA-like peptidoglycan-associated protein
VIRRGVYGALVVPVFALAFGALAGCDGEGAGPIGGNGGAQPGATTGLVIPPVPVPPPAPAPVPAPVGMSGSVPAPAGMPDVGVVYRPQPKVDELLNGSPIRFDPDSVALSDPSKAVLKQVAEAVHCPPESKIEVTAAARFEDAKKADEVSQQRADAVARELVAGGIAAERITAKGVGNQGVAADNTALTVKIRVV